MFFARPKEKEAANMKNNQKWWQKCAAVKRYMPEEEQLSIGDIVKELDTIIEDGYGAIHITAPYKSAGAYPWWGLRPLDYFQPNQMLGNDIAEFKVLVDTCHQKGLFVMIFLNLGYTDLLSPLWKEACMARKNGLKNSPADFFLWSHTGKDPLPITANEYFKQEGSWIYSPEADSYYWSHWIDASTYVDGKILAEPQYNWASDSWQNYAMDILNFWLDTGVDGIILDAVNWYANCDFSTIRRCITDVIHKRPGVCCIPEGAGGFGDEPAGWLTYGNFDIIENQPFHSDLDWNGSAIMDAICTESAKGLSSRLEKSQKVREKGGFSWSYLSFGKLDYCGNPIDWISQYRLLEIAVLIGTGHMVDLINTYLSHLSSKEKKKLKELLHTAKHPGLAPKESLRILKTSEPAAFVCLRSEHKFPVLCIYNFSSHKLQLTLSDLKVTVEPFGYLFLKG